MPLSNVIGLFFPVAVALGIGAAIFAYYYGTERPQSYDTDDPRRRRKFSACYSNSNNNNSNSQINPADVCVICLNDVDPGQTMKILPCLHKFHKKCIDEWIRNDFQKSCPICRTSVNQRCNF